MVLSNFWEEESFFAVFGFIGQAPDLWASVHGCAWRGGGIAPLIAGRILQTAAERRYR